MYHLPLGKHLDPQIKTDEDLQVLLKELFNDNDIPTVYLFNSDNDSPLITRTVKTKKSILEKSGNKDSSVSSGQSDFRRLCIIRDHSKKSLIIICRY